MENLSAAIPTRTAAEGEGVFLPGATIGMLGGGQLGRMFAMQARRMGWRVHVFDNAPGGPAAQWADRETCAEFSDEDALRAFAESVDVVTLEFENIPVRAAEIIAERVPLRPGAHVLAVCQNREREKNFLRDSGFPCASFAVVEAGGDLAAAIKGIGTPCVVKTVASGYDGKGQWKVPSLEAIPQVAREASPHKVIVEAWVDYERELSVVCARGRDGRTSCFPVCENQHENHILDFTIVPARVSADVAGEAQELAKKIAAALDVVGLITVEMFLTRDGRILVNELAPRPHNSGHFSIEACLTSQFEQHVRAVCGMPLGETTQHTSAVMWNLLGDVWARGEPDWDSVLAVPGAHLHLYGKKEPRAGRKMGHITFLDSDPAVALARAQECKRRLVEKARSL